MQSRLLSLLLSEGVNSTAATIYISRVELHAVATEIAMGVSFAPVAALSGSSRSIPPAGSSPPGVELSPLSKGVVESHCGYAVETEAAAAQGYLSPRPEVAASRLWNSVDPTLVANEPDNNPIASDATGAVSTAALCENGIILESARQAFRLCISLSYYTVSVCDTTL